MTGGTDVEGVTVSFGSEGYKRGQGLTLTIGITDTLQSHGDTVGFGSELVVSI